MGKSKLVRIAVLGAAIVVVAIGAVAGYAYWTSTGSGSGDAAVGTDSGVKVSDVSFSATLYPGATVDVSATMTNQSGDSKVKVDDLKLDVAGISTDTVGCDAKWFTYSEGNNSPQYLAKSGAAGDAATITAGTLSMSDEAAVNQDACKGAKVTLPLTLDNAGL